MTVRTRAQLNSDATTNLADNTSGDISPADVRQRVLDLADSAKLAEDFSANGLSLVAAADYAAMRALLDLEAGIDFYSKSGADAAFQPLDSDLTAVAGLSSAGLIARTGSGTAAARTITGTSNEVDVTNGDGVSGNPTVALAARAKLVTRIIPLTMWAPPASNYATLDTRNSHPVADFDTSTQEAIYVYGVMPETYAGGGLTLKLAFALTSATSGTLGCDAAFESLATQDIDSDSFATAKTGTAATVPGTSGQLQYFTITFSNSEIDGLAAGDPFRLRIRRDVANDNAAGDGELLLGGVRLEMTP